MKLLRVPAVVASLLCYGCVQTIPIDDGVEAAVDILNRFSIAAHEKENLLMPSEVTITFALTKEREEGIKILANSGGLGPFFSRASVRGSTVSVTFRSVAFVDAEKTAIHQLGPEKLAALADEAARKEIFRR